MVEVVHSVFFRSASVWLARESLRECSWSFGVSVIALLFYCELDCGLQGSMAFSCWCLFHVWTACSSDVDKVLLFWLPSLHTMLTKWSSTTRLETRTKESTKYASIWVSNPSAKWKYKMGRRTAAPSAGLWILLKVWVGAYLLGPERWWTMPE